MNLGKNLYAFLVRAINWYRNTKKIILKKVGDGGLGTPPLAGGSRSSGSKGRAMSPSVVGLVDGAQPLGSVIDEAAPVRLNFPVGPRSLDLGGGVVSPAAAGLAEGACSWVSEGRAAPPMVVLSEGALGMEGGVLAPVLIGFAKGARPSSLDQGGFLYFGRLAGGPQSSGSEGRTMSPSVVGLLEGAHPSGSVIDAAAPVRVGFPAGPRSLGLGGGVVSPVVAGLRRRASRCPLSVGLAEEA